MSDEPSRTAPESDRGAPVAQGTEESLAADAAAYIRRRADVFQSFRGSTQEIRLQAELLVEWARQKGRILTDACVEGLEKYPQETREHEVFTHESRTRV